VDSAVFFPFGVGVTVSAIWFYFCFRAWRAQTHRFGKLAILSIELGLASIIITASLESLATDTLGRFLQVVIMAPILEEVIKAAFVLGAMRSERLALFAGSDVKKLAVLSGFSFGAVEGLSYIFLNFGGEPSIVLALFSIARITPMHAVTTYLAVEGLTDRRLAAKALFLALAILIHSTVNYLGFGTISLLTIFGEWFVLGACLVTITVRIAPHSARG